MTETIEDLYRRMEAAAAALDFEAARALRDRIGLLRGGADPDSASRAETTGLIRQQPGAMGLGSSQPRPTPPPDWTPPARPDPMTSGRSNRRGRPRAR